MKREALIRAIRRYARKRGLTFEIDAGGGKGSHYRIRLGARVTTVQSGELSPLHVERICRQIDVKPGDL